MDVCRPMRVESINGKKIILVTVDDYSRYTWVDFLRTKDEAPEMIKKFIAQVQLNFNVKIQKVRTDNGTEFKNAILQAHYEKLGIMQQFLIARTPQHNGVVKRQNRTLVEATRTMLIFSKSPEFLWAEAISTACFTQNRSLMHTRYNKTSYELLRGRKPNVEYFHVFESLCYPTNEQEDLGKMKPKANIGIFIGYSESSRGFRSIIAEPERSWKILLYHQKKIWIMYKEYFEKRSPEVSINSAAPTTLNNQDTPSSSSIIVEDDEAPPLVSSSEEQISPISNNKANELI
ncbi:retrovirus-related pol polyprotein from transposon TNT 1-94 [Tanacetum coccineum]